MEIGSLVKEHLFTNRKGEVVERYVIEVKPTDTWKPKANSVGKVYISKSAYDEIMSTRETSRDKVPNMSLSVRLGKS
mgnify:CR=1 FL=1